MSNEQNIPQDSSFIQLVTIILDKVDTIPVVYLKFTPNYYKKEADKKRIQNWL
jgi:hypothetical protein